MYMYMDIYIKICIYAYVLCICTSLSLRLHGLESSEDVFAEHRDVLHERTQVEDRHQDSEEGAPHACPEVKWHELHVHGDCQIIDDKRVGQERTGSSQNRKGLTGMNILEKATG